MLTTRLTKIRCPHCTRPLDAAAGAFGDFKPTPGDYSVCLRCKGIMQFDAFLNLMPRQLDKIPKKDRAEIMRAGARIDAYLSQRN